MFPKIQHGHLFAVYSLLLAKWRYTLSTTKTRFYIDADVRPKQECIFDIKRHFAKRSTRPKAQAYKMCLIN